MERAFHGIEECRAAPSHSLEAQGVTALKHSGLRRTLGGGAAPPSCRSTAQRGIPQIGNGRVVMSTIARYLGAFWLGADASNQQMRRHARTKRGYGHGPGSRIARRRPSVWRRVIPKGCSPGQLGMIRRWSGPCARLGCTTLGGLKSHRRDPMPPTMHPQGMSSYGSWRVPRRATVKRMLSSSSGRDAAYVDISSDGRDLGLTAPLRKM